MTKISIITPVYCDISQKIDWLDEMIQSVLPQTVTDWELILIDDKSPLALDSLRFKYQDEPRLRWLENSKNYGPAMTRNTAVGLATSECILPLDSDDMLASPEVLEAMYDAWIVDTTKIIYGNLQMYTPIDNSGRFQRGKVIELGQYTFELAMNLEGLMPVTAMHSKTCHEKAFCTGELCLDENGHPIYGWKSSLKAGLEDVEYWISAGEQGFCGQKINTTTLVYRQQEGSRAYKLKHDINPKFRVMQNQIKQIHKNVYLGRWPVACCGKQASVPINNPVVNQGAQSGGIKYVTELPDYDEKDLEWVLYDGGKKASVGSVLARGGPNLPNEYPVMGKGHIFQIHKSHHKLFSDRQRLGFKMNQPDPRNREPEPEPEIQIEIAAPTVTEIPKPDMSTIKRIDKKALEVAEPVIQAIPPDFMEVIIEPNPSPFISDTITGYPFHTPNLQLSDLDLTKKLTALLDKNQWTIELLAKAKVSKLTSLPGIGIKRANTIIEKAKELIMSA